MKETSGRTQNLYEGKHPQCRRHTKSNKGFSFAYKLITNTFYDQYKINPTLSTHIFHHLLLFTWVVYFCKGEPPLIYRDKNRIIPPLNYLN